MVVWCSHLYKQKKYNVGKSLVAKDIMQNIDTCNAIPNGWMGLDIGPEIYKIM